MNNSFGQQVGREIDQISEGQIPSIAAAISQDTADFENENVVLSFTPYNQSQCEIMNLDKKAAKKLTQVLQRVSNTLTKHLRHMDRSNLDCKPVIKAGRYESLFLNVPPDAELLEIDYTDAGRIFGFLVKNIFNVVAIKTKHL